MSFLDLFRRSKRTLLPMSDEGAKRMTRRIEGDLNRLAAEGSAIINSQQRRIAGSLDSDREEDDCHSARDVQWLAEKRFPNDGFNQAMETNRIVRARGKRLAMDSGLSNVPTRTDVDDSPAVTHDVALAQSREMASLMEARTERRFDMVRVQDAESAISTLSQRIWNLEHPGQKPVGVGIRGGGARRSGSDVSRPSLHDEAVALIQANELQRQTPSERRVASPDDFNASLQKMVIALDARMESRPRVATDEDIGWKDAFGSGVYVWPHGLHSDVDMQSEVA